MALTKRIEYSEKDIEDWLWENPDKVDWVDGWIERQLVLPNNSRLDLLGFKTHNGKMNRLVLVELKANPIQKEDLHQILLYFSELKYLQFKCNFEQLDITKVLVGTNTSISNEMLDLASVLEVFIYSAKIDNDDGITVGSGHWRYNYDYYVKYIDKADRMIDRGVYEKLQRFVQTSNSCNLGLARKLFKSKEKNE